MRLFIAIDMPENVKGILSDLCREIPGVRWVPQEQLHLTLLFLGDIGQEKLDLLCNALADVTIQQFTLTLGRTGCFPHPKAPRILWVGIDPHPALAELALCVRQAVETCGIPIEEKPFSPHITVARIRQPGTCNATGFINRPVHPLPVSFPVREFTLYQSSLTPQGAIHTAIKLFWLVAL